MVAFGGAPRIGDVAVHYVSSPAATCLTLVFGANAVAEAAIGADRAKN